MIVTGVFQVGGVSGAALVDGDLLLVTDDVPDADKGETGKGGLLLIQDGAKRLANCESGALCSIEEDMMRTLQPRGFDKLDDLEDADLDPQSGWVYLVTSHSRNKKNEVKKKRSKLARLRLGEEPQLEQDDWLFWQLCARLPELAASLLRTPAQGGLNIEGLVCTPEGDLLLGLRSPTATLPALNRDNPEVARVLRVRHPVGIWDDGAKLKPELEELPPIDLGGQGIRGLCRDEAGEGYWILSNLSVDPNHEARSAWHLWHWDGPGDQQPQLYAAPEACSLIANPEALCFVKAGKTAQLLIIEDRVLDKKTPQSRFALVPVGELQAVKSKD